MRICFDDKLLSPVPTVRDEPLSIIGPDCEVRVMYISRDTHGTIKIRNEGGSSPPHSRRV